MANLDIIVRVKGDGSVELKKITETAKQAEASTKSLTTSTGALSSAYSSLRSAIAGVAIGVMVKEAIQMADTYKSMSGRLSLVTKNTQELTTAQSELFKISQNTRQSYEETTGLYTNLATSMQQMGKSQKDILATTETVNKAIAISGSTTQQASSAIMQLGQAFASGTLRGDELNSIMENSKGLAQAIADGMGVPIGKLRELGSEGKITSEILAEALTKSADTINAKFEKMPVTVGQSMTQMENSLLIFIGKLDEATGASEDLSSSITGLSKDLDQGASDFVVYGQFAYATLDRTKDMFMLLGSVALNSAELAIDGIAIIVYGALGGITQLMAMATKGLNNVGLASDESLRQNQALADSINNQYRVALKGAETDWNDINDAVLKASPTVEDRIKQMQRLGKATRDAGGGTTPPAGGSGGKGPTKSEISAQLREQAQLKKDNLEIDNKIFALTHSESEIRLREIDQQATAYREAKISEVKVNEWATGEKKKITDKETQDSIDARIEFETIVAESRENYKKEVEKDAEDRKKADMELSKEMNQMSGDFYANELMRIDEVAEASKKAGVDEIKILEYKEMATKQAYDNMGLGIIKASEVTQNAVKGLEDALVTAFTTGKFEADKMFQAIFADLARLAIRQSITGPLSSGIMSMFASANGNAFVSGQPVTAFANGGAFSNKVVSSPTVAPMALFGEAGPEAIMPLTRTSDGKLGVATTGGGQQAPTKVEIINQSGEEVKATSATSRFDGEQFVISVVIDAMRRNKGGMRDIMGNR